MHSRAAGRGKSISFLLLRFFPSHFSSSHPIPGAQKQHLSRAQGYAFGAYPTSQSLSLPAGGILNLPPPAPQTRYLGELAAPRLWRWRLDWEALSSWTYLFASLSSHLLMSLSPQPDPSLVGTC